MGLVPFLAPCVLATSLQSVTWLHSWAEVAAVAGFSMVLWFSSAGLGGGLLGSEKVAVVDLFC